MPAVATAVAAAVTYVTTASAAVAAGTATFAQFATVFAVNAAAGAALSAATTALMAPRTGKGGSPTAFKADPAAPVRGVMGRFGVAGTQIHMRSWGKKNTYLSYMAILSLGPIDSYEAFKANDQTVTFPGAQGVATSGPYINKMWQTRKLGLPTDAALGPPTGIADASPTMSEWTSAHKTSGHAAYFWTLGNDSKRAGYPTGTPNPLMVGKWMKLWDPRLDSTYPGGVGSQRRDDWSTWAWTQNPYLHALAWTRGHFKNLAGGSIDRTKRLAGIGAPDRAIDIAAFVEGANVADANAWTIAGEWTTADDKWSVLAAMLQAGGGTPLNRGAQISVMVNTPRASVLTYTKADMAGPAKLSLMPSRRDRLNTVIPRYREESQKWEVVAAGAVTSSVYLTEDRNEPRSREIEYGYVAKAKQAAELAAYDVANSREGLTGQLPSKPYMLGLRAGDAFTVNDDELAMTSQKMLVMQRALDPSQAIVTLDVRSETDGKHPWALGQVANPPPSPSLTPVDPSVVEAPAAGSWSAAAVLITSADGQVPIIRITGAVDDANVSAIVVDYRPVGAGSFRSQSFPTQATQLELSGLTGLTSYELRIRYASARGGEDPATYLALGTVTTGASIAGTVVGQGPWATDQRDPTTITSAYGYAAARSIPSFGADQAAKFSLVNCSASTPPGATTGEIRLTRTASNPYFNMTAVNFAGVLGKYLTIFRAKVRAVSAQPVANAWRGLIQVYGTFSDGATVKTKTVSFPANADGSIAVPTSKYVWATWDFTGEAGWDGATITSARLYLVPSSAGDGVLDVDWITVGSNNLDPLGMQNVQPNATDGATAGDNLYQDNGTTVMTQAEVRTSEGTARYLDGEGALARQDYAAWGSRVSGRPTELIDGRVAAGLDASGDLARNLTTSRLNGSNVLRRTAGGLFIGELTADETGGHTAAYINNQGLQATQDRPTIQQLPLMAGPNLYPDPQLTQVDTTNYTVLSSTQATGWSVTVVAGDGGPSLNQINIQPDSTNNRYITTPATQVEEGRIYQIGCWAEVGGSGSNSASVYYLFRDKNGADLNNDLIANFGSTTPASKSLIVQAPAGARQVVLRLVIAPGSRNGSFSAPFVNERVRNDLLSTPASMMTSAMSFDPGMSSSVYSGAARITIDPFVMKGNFGEISYSGGNINGLAYATTYYLWMIDQTFAGGTVTFVATTTKAAYADNLNYVPLGSYTTCSAGGAPVARPTPDISKGGVYERAV